MPESVILKAVAAVDQSSTALKVNKNDLRLELKFSHSDYYLIISIIILGNYEK